MESSKKSARPLPTDDDINVDEFARQFFGTDQDYNRTMPPKSLPVNNQEKHRRRPEDNLRKETTPGAQKDKNLDNLIARGPNVNHNREFSVRNRNINRLKGERGPGPVQASRPKDSKQVILTRFMELRQEFYALSRRLESVNMPKISKRLTQVLAERQKLLAMLLEMGGLSNGGSSYSDDEKVHYERFPRDSQRSRIGMPKKSKSVHWSDDCLEGSITQDHTLTVREPGKPATLKARVNNKSRYPADYSDDDSKNSSQVPWSHRQQPTHQVHHYHEGKMPPAYKLVDTFTQTRRRRRSPSQCDTQGSLCSLGIGHALGCIEEIVNEAAALRHEACCMLWRAHYLEQLCDADGSVNHVYHAASNLPALPRYSHSHQNDR